MRLSRKLFRKKEAEATPSKEEELLDYVRRMEDKINQLSAPSPAYPLTRSRTKEELQQNISELLENQKNMEEKLFAQTEMLRQKIEMLQHDESTVEDGDSVENLVQGSFEVFQDTNFWKVTGYASVEPHPDLNYFAGLEWGPKTVDGIRFTYNENKVISAIIPCFNERGVDLHRTIRSLYRQRIPIGWRIEVVIVMDGADHMDPSMSAYLSTLFGIKINSEDPELDPFTVFPKAETIIVDPKDETAASSRTPAMEGSVGGYSLVVKRHNHRKANSQMWWLGPHAQYINCKYALATDCGTVFARTATTHLIRRLDAEPNVHAVTGFQRIMQSEMQGDGSWEFFHKPFDFLLRMVQRFEFEVDHVSFKTIYDSVGAMHVIPGPCGLFRYSAMGSLKEGLMHNYFRLFQRSSQGLIVGNVELVEDRIPGTLLSFPLKGDKQESEMPPEGWPRTGFVHEATFYIEAEKPLSQLVKQRRRWLNGTFATYIWMLTEGLITRSNQDAINKMLSWVLVLLNVVQGLVVRLFGPALLTVWMFRFGLFIPDLFQDPTVIFDPEMSLVELEIEQSRLPYGFLAGGLYFLLYVAFIVGHIPHAKPATNDIKIIRYTEPTSYRSDKKSAYRGWLFIPSLWVNFFVICLFVVNAIGIVATQGWTGTPIVVRILICICFAPFFMGICEGLIRRDFRCLFGMFYSAPFALCLSSWFTIWLPAYATTRLSDLTWGNREGMNSLDESAKALKRAKDGRRTAWILVGCNFVVSLITIGLMQFFDSTFPIFVMSYTLILSVTYVLSFIDLVWRFFTCQQCYSEDPVIEGKEDDDFIICGDIYVEMDEYNNKADFMHRTSDTESESSQEGSMERSPETLVSKEQKEGADKQEAMAGETSTEGDFEEKALDKQEEDEISGDKQESNDGFVYL